MSKANNFFTGRGLRAGCRIAAGRLPVLTKFLKQILGENTGLYKGLR